MGNAGQTDGTPGAGAAPPKAGLPANWAEHALEALATPVCVRDAASRFAWANRCYLQWFGGGRASLAGLSLEDVLPPALARSEREADRAELVRHSGVPPGGAPTRSGQAAIAQPSGSGRRAVLSLGEADVWLLCGAPAPTGERTPPEVSGWSARAHTLRRHRRLAAAYVAACLAHEIRNPLAAICNAVAVLQRRLRGSSDQVATTALNMAHEEAWRIERRVAATITNTSDATPQLRSVSLADLTAFARTAHGGPLRVELSAEERAQSVEVDPEQVETIFDLILSHCLLGAARDRDWVTPTLRCNAVAQGEFVELTLQARNLAKGPALGAEAAALEPDALGDWALPIARMLLERQGGALEYCERSGGLGLFTLRFARAAACAR